jgi:hypothetical protein
MRSISRFVFAVVLFGLVATGARAEEEVSLADVMQAQRQACSSLSRQELLDKGTDCPKVAKPVNDTVSVIAGIVSFAALAASVFTNTPTATLGLMSVSIGADQVGK